MGNFSKFDNSSLIEIVTSNCSQIMAAWNELEHRGFGKSEDDFEGLCLVLRSCPCQCVRVKAQNALNRINDRLRDERATVAA
ncbi:MAG: hypothetical protein UV64_C0013G0007 [Parcubacteria group bacterium GW2011_GWC1_43_11b]|nr:MAG: hypothetical protein UV50_C0013G0006 [Parcubacteria group bacterium GW2011_GWB1_42_9]KKS89050.1 MAG: hypothetical protein UV64_C0013G0007 [Parcubacteria group bacterium GW2011_GWC1_43_11b]KKT09482.1 MAG: hypothetical protein UV88_C0009G0006 [Parcubacteria group bacterium GW2011_GWA1_43_21]